MKRVVWLLFFLTLLFVAFAACTQRPTDPSGRPITPADNDLDDVDLVGTTLPEWTTTDWINPAPGADGTPGKGTTLAELRGRVVLIRWFMGTSCPFCNATAPALKKFHADYASRGLVVIGLYHHKEEGALHPGQYEGYVRSFGFAFPVARDPDWKTLSRWWLTKDRDFTSVSFLLDRSGRVRGVHKGGRYAPGESDYDAMRRGIERLLVEPPPSTTTSTTTPSI